MKTEMTMDFSVDKDNNKIHVKREFAAPLKTVWAAWTQSGWLDQWWAPKPWKAETKSMDFREGGQWLYAMVGPEGEKHWSIADYTKINPEKSFEGLDAFTDENGTVNPEMPRSKWKVSFSESGDSTMTDIELAFDNAKDLQMNLDMGFEEGFTKGLENLDALLKQHRP